MDLREQIRIHQKHAESIRNVCILAHVDHGKTTIADCLLATNGIINKRMVGNVRYLDDRKDEQEKGITMKCSSVSLMNFVNDTKSVMKVPLILNLVDTPGHIDFTSEIKAALRVCDGALIVVDLVEGVNVQTREALKLGFEEHCRMILVLNKMDRLILEISKDISDVFNRILRCIEGCNAIIAELYGYEQEEVDIESTDLLFSPPKGNVIFASALDGWGFTIGQMANTFSKNTTLSQPLLEENLWNFDAYANSNKNQICYGAIEKKKKNLFTQLCLKTIYYIYDSIIIKSNMKSIKEILLKLSLDIKLDTRQCDMRTLLKTIMSTWKPLSGIILQQSYDYFLPPFAIPRKRINYLLDSKRFSDNDYPSNCINELAMNFNCCENDQAPIIGYVSKMFCVNKNNILGDKRRHDDDFIVVGLARVFSGKLRVGQELYVLPPTYIPDDNFVPSDIDVVRITQLYLLFGRDLLSVEEVEAGNICGIGGIDNQILRTATLSNTFRCLPFIENTSVPIVRNSIEPTDPNDLPTLRKGLRLLVQSDSCVDVITQESGELILVTAGDVHFGKCIEDLTNKFAKIPVNISSPMVSLRETILVPDDYDLSSNTTLIDSQFFRMELSMIGLPYVVSKEINKFYKTLSFIEHQNKFHSFDVGLKQIANKSNIIYLKNHLRTAFTKAGPFWMGLIEKLWSIGDSGDSINLLVNLTEDYRRNLFETIDKSDRRSFYDNVIVNAFNNFCKSGPICGEPLMDCVLVVSSYKIVENESDGNEVNNLNIETNLCNAFRTIFEKHEQRLMEPIFSTNIEININVLGAVNSVIHKRHGEILETLGMDEDEKKFMVKAEIPVIESNGFVNEIRTMTSGQANPLLKFSRYKMIPDDPYYQPNDDDENDDDEDISMRATTLRRDVRKRKGLHVDEQIIIHAEKQRTRKKKK